MDISTRIERKQTDLRSKIEKMLADSPQES